MIKLLLIFNALNSVNLETCYTLENNDNIYCYNETLKDYTIDYISEVALVNYYKIKENK